ncbi:hypothetical protein RJJ65_40025, partial [Rhizobium hidalgonense]
ITAILPVIDAPKKFKERFVNFKAFVESQRAALQQIESIQQPFTQLEEILATLSEDSVDELPEVLKAPLKALHATFNDQIAANLDTDTDIVGLGSEVLDQFAEQVQSVVKNHYVFMATQ